MATISVIDPGVSMRLAYPDPAALDTYNIVAAKSLLAPISDSGQCSTLTIGATSNIAIESVGDTNVYLRDASTFKMFQTSFVAGTRFDYPMLDVDQPAGAMATTVISTGASTAGGSNVLWVHGSDACMTTRVSTAQVRNLNDYTQFATTQPAGFIINNSTLFASNAVFTQDVRVKSTLEVDGNLTLFGNFYSQNVNLWKDSVEKNQRVGFGFRINEKSQLELIKYATFDSGNVVTKKVAVFGNTPMVDGVDRSDGTSYLVFDELYGGIGVSSSAASNQGQPTTTSSTNSWRFNQTGNVTTSSYVGIGKVDPLHQLDVAGVANVDSLTASNVCAVEVCSQTITTTSDERMKNIFGETVYCLDKVQKLRVIDFTYKNRPEVKKTGLSAQNVRDLIPEAVVVQPFSDVEDCMHIDNSVLIGYLVGAIKELAGLIKPQ